MADRRSPSKDSRLLAGRRQAAPEQMAGRAAVARTGDGPDGRRPAGLDGRVRAERERLQRGAPATVAGPLEQRFRGAFGALPCLRKHRAAWFEEAWPVLGFVASPRIWL